MYSRSSMRSGRTALRCLQCGQKKRGFAAPASGSFAYQTGDAAGVKYASRDLAGPTTTLALVAKAGTRYQGYPGLSEGLKNFAFRNTSKRSALRITRETELLGSELIAYHSRENLVIGAKFIRDDLPYFVELLSEVAGETKYQDHVFTEEVLPQLKLSQQKYLASPSAIAHSNLHTLAFHRGLGEPLFPSATSPFGKYLDASSIAEFAGTAYGKGSFALVANGADQAELGKWVNEFFGEYQSPQSSGAFKATSEQSKYHGGEMRVPHAGGNTILIGFAGSSSFTGQFYKPESSVLATLLGGQSQIKWTSGYSLLGKACESFPGAAVKTKSAIYSDAGLLYTQISGSAADVSSAAKAVVDTIKKVASGEVKAEDIKKAKAQAKFKELEWAQNVNNGIELTGTGLLSAAAKAYQTDETAKSIDSVDEGKVRAAAKALLESKASVATVGDLFVLPFAEEMGLNV